MTIYNLLRGCSCCTATMSFHRKILIISRLVFWSIRWFHHHRGSCQTNGIRRIVLIVVLSNDNQIQKSIQLTACSHSSYWRNWQTYRIEKTSRSPNEGTSHLQSSKCILQILSIFHHSSWVLEVKGLQLPGRSVLPWSVGHRSVALWGRLPSFLLRGCGRVGLLQSSHIRGDSGICVGCVLCAWFHDLMRQQCPLQLWSQAQVGSSEVDQPVDWWSL